MISRRAVMLGIAALIPVPTQAKKRKRHRLHESFTVIDRTPPEWDGVVAEMVDKFNAVMPPRGPKILYERGDPAVCADDIGVCVGNTMPYLGIAAITDTPGEAEIILTDQSPITRELQEAITCHEFMHAISGIRDCYGCQIDSCVHGWRRSPGSFDVKYLKKTFGKRRKHRKKH